MKIETFKKNKSLWRKRIHKTKLEEVIKILDLSNTKLHKLIAQVLISHQITECHIGAISKNIANNLICDLQNCKAFSLSLSESTDILDVPLLAILICYVHPDVNVKEEMLDLVAFIETTCGINVRNLLEVMNRFKLPHNKPVNVATDRTPAMMGEKKKRSHWSFKQWSENSTFLSLHCIIHHKHLVAKYFKYENVWKIVLQVVNLIKTNAKIHCQFKNFLDELQVNDEIDELSSDLALYCFVKWLSTYVLSRFVELLYPIITFTKVKGKKYRELEIETWLSDLMFLTDVLEHLLLLNLALQGKEKNITNLSPTILFWS